MTNVVYQISRTKMKILKNTSGQLASHLEKEKFNSYLPPYTRVNSKYIKNFN